MNDAEIVEKTIAFVKDRLKGAEGGHDWFHIQRVFRNTMLIARHEDVHILVVSLGALLHDIADAKFHGGDETIGPGVAAAFLKDIAVDDNIIAHVQKIIQYCSFKNSLDPKVTPFSSKELQVVRDADTLDAMGAIGIARAFNYGGFKNRKLHDPEVPPRLKMTKEDYKKGNGPTINHFYEKLLLLKDRMNTTTGKRLADQRHQFMLRFLEQFYSEWNGEEPHP